MDKRVKRAQQGMHCTLIVIQRETHTYVLKALQQRPNASRSHSDSVPILQDPQVETLEHK